MGDHVSGVCAVFAPAVLGVGGRKEARGFDVPVRRVGAARGDAPLAAWVARETWRLEVGDAGFNGTLSAAAALHLLFGSALALGLALDGVAWRD